MLEQLKQAIRYDNDGDRSRMILQLEAGQSVMGFQVDMIRKNQVQGILSLDLRSADGRVQLNYETGNRWRLKDLLDNRQFSRNEFLGILDRITRAMTGADAYLLDLGQFVLDEELIFLDRELQPSLMYLPFRVEQDIHRQFKEFLLQVIVYRAKLNDRSSGLVLSGILNMLKQEDFTIHAFQKSLSELWMDSGAFSTEALVAQQAQEEAASIRPPSLMDLIPEEHRRPSTGVQAPKPVKAKEATERPAESGRVAGTGLNAVSGSMGKTPAGTGGTTLVYKPSVLILAVLLQVVLVIGASMGFGPVYSLTEDLLTTYAALGMMAVCLDGLALRSLFRPENRVPVPVREKKTPPVKPVRETPKRPRTASQSLKPSGVPQRSASVPLPVVSPVSMPKQPLNLSKQVFSNMGSAGGIGSMDTAVLMPEPGGHCPETEVLTASSGAPYLAGKGHAQAVIRLEKPRIVVGRQPDMADHVIQDSAVGRMHAEINCVGASVSIRDLNSRNGTFVNGQRLSGPQPVPLRFGDEVRLGSLDFILMQD